MTDIAIARMSLHLAVLPPPVGSPDELVHAVLNSLERELDTALGPMPHVVVIPRIDLYIQIPAGGVSSVAEAIARRLATQIVEAVILAGSTVDTSAARANIPNEQRQRALLGAARALFEGISLTAVEALAARSMDGAAALPGTGSALQPGTSIDRNAALSVAELIGADGGSVYEILGRIARQRRLRPLVRALLVPESNAGDWASARTLLLRILASLQRGRTASDAIPSPTARAAAAARLRASQARAQQRLAEEARAAAEAEPALSRAALLVLAIAEESRLLPDRIERSPALMAAVMDAIAALEGFADDDAADSATLPAPRNALLWAEPARALEPSPASDDAEISELAPFERRSSGAVELEASVELAASVDLPAPVEPEVAPVALDETFAEEDREARIETAVAGLAFLIQPLLDLGWAEALDAVSEEPTLLLVSVLRRVLELADAPREAAEDPAVWLLAGLLDAPTDEELAAEGEAFGDAASAALARAAGGEATTVAGACDAWARAAIAEAKLRLEGTSGAAHLANDVLLVSGAIVSSDDRVEVILPFIGAYEALLRAGLLADIPAVPWFGDRPLRLIFEGPQQGGKR